MLVKGALYCEIDISSEEAIKGLYKKFGIGDCNSIYEVREENGIKGVYRGIDISHHGSSQFNYTLIHEGEEAIEVFEALQILKEKYNKVLEEKENNNKTKIK